MSTINCYAATNLLSGLAATAFTWSAGLNDTTRARLNDARMDSRYVNGSPTTSLAVVIDLGSAIALTGFAVLNSNCAIQKTVSLKVESADDSGMSTNLVVRKAATTLDAIAPRNKDHVVQFASGTARRYWRLTWAWTGTITSFAIGELWAFVSQVQLSRKSIYGGGESREFKLVDVQFYSGGSRSYKNGGPIRELTLPYQDLTSSQIEELYTMQAAVSGGAAPFLWIPSYEATATAAADAEQEVIYGKITTPKFAFSENDYLLYTPNAFVITSLGREVGS